MTVDKKNDAQYKDKLTKEEFYVCREKGTERAFTGEYWDTKTSGIYVCRCCGEPLFGSDTKYDSGSGWPSFYKPLNNGAIEEISDHTLGMARTEVVCQQCDGHLGHVFPDGPAPTGLRYCINSLSIKLHPEGVDAK